MTDTNKMKRALPGTTNIFLITLGIFLSTSIFQKSQAALNDVAFNECIQALDQSPDALLPDTWHKTPLNARIEQLIEPSLYGDVVIRWINHKNQNGTITIVVLTRDPEPQPEDDPDGFYVILEQYDHLSLKADVGINGFSFSKESDKGVNGLLFCTRGQIFKWQWSGNTWKYYDGSTSK
jgi:hypothetical protein